MIRWAKPLFMGGLAGLLVSAVLMVAFFSANGASLGHKLPQARAHIAQAFASGELGEEDWLRGNSQTGQHQFNDCLILGMAVDQRGPSAHLAVSPIFPGSSDLDHLCADLKGWINGAPAAGPPLSYHNYLHGHTLLARWMLPEMSVSAIRALYRNALVLVVMAGLGLALTGLARRKAVAANLFWAAIFISFARFFGLEAFGPSLSHGPSDLVALSGALVLCVATQRGGMGVRAAMAFGAVLGSFTILFEFLTGGIPLGLALVTGGMAFAIRSDARDAMLQSIIGAFGAFCAAVATGLLAKAIVTLHVFGLDAVRATAKELGARMALNDGPRGAIDTGLYPFAKGVLKGLDGLVPGTHLMSALMILMTVIAGAWGIRQLWRSVDSLTAVRVRALLLSNALIALLLLMFWQHTMIHAWFMDRVLAWMIGSGLALFGLALIERDAGVQPQG
ncbi:MAG TPA: hypothetical protein PKA59_09120 [Chakrabartia sp.]|jgi:hypothetical protein|nr:hypothetical protein [Chakrabartia sp.]